MNIIHLSDLHIGKSDNDRKVSRITEWLIKHRSRHESNTILITGDIVDDGATWQYHRAHEHVHRLRENDFQVLCVPGNHDYGPLGITESQRSAANFQEYLAGDVQYPHLEIIERQAFILLDSMFQEIQDVEFWGAEGELGEDQIHTLDQILQRLAGDDKVEKVVIALHHHPFEYKRFHQLRDAEQFLETITAFDGGESRVNALLFGHKHVAQRFNQPPLDKEAQYGLDLIYAAGSSVERDQSGRMNIPVIDLTKITIHRFKIK